MGLLDDYGDDLAALAVYGVGIALFTLAVAILYVPLGTRMMFARRFGERRVATPARRFAYVLLFPLMSFAFFLVIAASMLFMSDVSGGSSLGTKETLTIAMGVVLAVRICAYFNETAAADLAKVMPLSMLAVTLVVNGFADLRQSLENMKGLDDDRMLLVLYFLVIVVVEFGLRAIYEVLGRPGKGRDPRDPSPGLQKRPQA